MSNLLHNYFLFSSFRVKENEKRWFEIKLRLPCLNNILMKKKQRESIILRAQHLTIEVVFFHKQKYERFHSTLKILTF